MSTLPRPNGYATVTPYLVIEDVDGVIEFAREVFNAVEVEPPMRRPDGSIVHASIRVEDSMIMMGQPAGEFTPVPSMLYVYVEDVDSAYSRALAAGATSMMEPADQFYGDRNAGVRDRSGNLWWIATHRENVSRAEMEARAAALHGTESS